MLKPTLGISYDAITFALDPDLIVTTQTEMDGTPKYVGATIDGSRMMVVEGMKPDIQYAHYFMTLPGFYPKALFNLDDDAAPQYVRGRRAMIEIASFVTGNNVASRDWLDDCLKQGVGTYERTDGKRRLYFEVGRGYAKLGIGPN